MSLERLLDDAKPPVPAGAAHLHWLLFTPFRYPPPPGGSRFRGPNDPGVFYGADAIRTACAELGYWRWRHLLGFAGADGDADQAANGVSGPHRDRNGRPSRASRSCAIGSTGPTPHDYSRCQRFGRTAREAGVGAIRYESVRDPKHDGVLRGAFAGRVRPSGPARAADLDAFGHARAGRLAANARAPCRRARIRRGAMVAIRALGRTDYEPTWRAMQAFTAARTADTPDEIWLTEHPPVYTLGLAGRREHLLRDNGIPAIKVDRGGQITYHGPGQLVVYLLCDLRRAQARRSRDGPGDRGGGGRMA